MLGNFRLVRFPMVAGIVPSSTFEHDNSSKFMSLSISLGSAQLRSPLCNVGSMYMGVLEICSFFKLVRLMIEDGIVPFKQPSMLSS